MWVEREIVLPVPPAEAWSVLIEWERQADWMLDADRVEVRSTAREGAGVRLVVRTRVLGMLAFDEPMEVTVWDPPRRLEIRHGSVVAGVGVWRLEAIDDGTRFVWSEDVRLQLPLVGEVAARLYGPVLRWLIGRSQAALRRHVIAIGPVR
jgi:carbon monoxide dehydrogenase subunit G